MASSSSKINRPLQGRTGAPGCRRGSLKIDMPTIPERLLAVRERITQTARACGRDPATVCLVAVSKTRPAEDVRAALAAGQHDFGENYLQDALPKIQALSGADIRWHFIGPIQSNKTRDIARHFDWVHSIDRIKIAQRLSAQRAPEQAPLQVCLQVNIDAEVSKAGFAPAAVAAADAIALLPQLRLRGLMCIPHPSSDPSGQRAGFAALRALLTQLQQRHPHLDTLSMGMSADLEAAIVEGATLVRVGTDIFGPRLSG